MRIPSPSDPVLSLCRSFAIPGELEAIEVVDGVGAAILRDSSGKLDAVGRTALIEAVRAGKHIELNVRATTFRQRDGSPNKNFLRFKSSKLSEIAATFASRPFLLNHDKWSQESRMGTIGTSEAAPLAGGWVGFRQGLHVVKPHGVISVLDGTIDQFSIGWDPSGPIHCTVHKVDVRSKASCWRDGCYPGKLWEIDGESKIAEYEWQSTHGTEVSGVNSPAVSGTKIENVAQLAAELSLSNDPILLDERPSQMLHRLAAILALTPATGSNDEATVLRVAEERLAAGSAATQERDAAIARAVLAEGKVAAAELLAKNAAAAELATKVDALLADAYKAGKLIHGKDADGKNTPSPREARLRRIASEVDGLASLSAELKELPVVSPVGADPVLKEEDPNPRPSHGPIPADVLASTAKQMGLSVEELTAHHNLLRNEGNN